MTENGDVITVEIRIRAHRAGTTLVAEETEKVTIRESEIGHLPKIIHEMSLGPKVRKLAWRVCDIPGYRY